MTTEQLLVILKSKRKFINGEIAAITDLNLDFKKVINYNIFMKLDKLNAKFKKINNGIEELTKKYEQIRG